MKKLIAIALWSLLVLSCAKDSEPEQRNGKPGDITLSLSLFDFGQVYVDTRSYNLNNVADMVILQFIEGKCVAKSYLTHMEVTFSPAVALKSMAGNTPGNVVLVFCNFTELNGGTDPFAGVTAHPTTGSPLSMLDVISVPYHATTDATPTHLPIRGVYTGLIDVGATQAIDIAMNRMYAKIDFTLVNSFPGFIPLSVRLCQFSDRVSAHSTVPVIGADSNPENFKAFPTGATYANLDPEPVTGEATSKHLWSINENCMGTWNDVALDGGTAWSNFHKYPGAASTSNNYQQTLADAPQGSYYDIAATTPYIEINGMAMTTTSGVPADVTYKIYLGSDAMGDMNILGNYIYYVTTDIKGINVLDSRITTISGTPATPLPPSNSYMIKADANSGTPEVKLGIPLIQAQYGQTAVANITGTTAPTIDFAQTSVGVVWQTMAGSDDLQRSLDIDNHSVPADLGSYYVTLDFSTLSIPSGHNAVIALYSGPNQTGTILWSWHLWFTDYQPDASYPNMYGQIDHYLANPTKALMDRNLGATITGVSEGIALKMSTDAVWAQNNAAKLYGLLYQWGRKDPHTNFDGVDVSNPDFQVIYDKTGTLIQDNITLDEVKSTNMLAASVLNPSTYYYTATYENYDWYTTQANARNDNLWLPGTSATGNNPASNNPANRNKSIFDPCPPGWKIPIGGLNIADNPWAGFNGMALDGSVGDPTAQYTFVSGGTTVDGLTPEDSDIFQMYSQGKLPSGTTGLYTPVSAHATNGRLFSHDGTLAWYPATGHRFRTSGGFVLVGTYGFAWSSTAIDINGYYFYFSPTDVCAQFNSYRIHGLPVRCIQE